MANLTINISSPITTERSIKDKFVIDEFRIHIAGALEVRSRGTEGRSVRGVGGDTSRNLIAGEEPHLD